ncbi:MAG: hypothetical protein ACE5IL_00625 [Myxococcota bacterium]
MVHERTGRAAALGCWLAGLAALSIGAAPAGIGEWGRVADQQTIQLRTHDPDGPLRETTIWLAVVDGNGYIRTGSTRWRANIVRNRDITVQIAGQWYPMRATDVTDPAQVARVVSTLRAKYGLPDRLLAPFRGWMGGPFIMRLDPRDPARD